MPSEKGQSALARIREELDNQAENAPRESIERHYQNLERLADSLRTLGLNDEQVDSGVMEVFQEYRSRLAEYLATVAQGRGRD